MKISIINLGAILIVVIVITAITAIRFAPQESAKVDDSQNAIDLSLRTFQDHLTTANAQAAIVAELEKSYYHITYDFLETPSSDPTPAVKRLVEKYGRDFVGKPYYIGNSITTDNAKLISKLPSLQIVDFDDSGVADDVFVHLGKLPKLRVLFLNCTLVSEKGLALLTETPLEVLHLQNCANINDRCIDVLSKFDSLRKLYISDQNFSDSAIQRLKSALPDCIIE